jgi:Na+-transporting methylmalonyl-CoA/oxaloacetate decarboxylase gamma subunit
MSTSNLMEGLQLFIVGFGGVFANLVLVYVAISVTGWLIRWRDRRAGGAEET